MTDLPVRPMSTGLRKGLYNRLAPKARSFLLSIYGSAEAFICAEETGEYTKVSYLEEACLTYDSALIFLPSVEVVLQILTDNTNYNYMSISPGEFPITRAEMALARAIEQYHRV